MKLLDKIKSFLASIKRVGYTDRSNAWKAALSTAAIVFFTSMLGSTLTLWSSIQEWATNSGENPEILDDLAIWGKAFVSAAFAGVTGIANYIFRKAQELSNKVPGSGPTYGSPVQVKVPQPEPPKPDAPWPPPSLPVH